MNNLSKLLAMSKDFDIREIDIESDDFEVYPMKGYPHFYARFTKGTYYIVDSEYTELDENVSMVRDKAVDFRDKTTELRNTAFGYVVNEDYFEEIDWLIDFCELIIKAV